MFPIARRRHVAAAAALSLLALIAVPSAGAAALPQALTEGTPQFAVRPAQIGYTGDGSGFVGGRRTATSHFGHVTWTSWTTRAARGRGRVWLNDCEPSCAGGTFHGYRATVGLTRPSGGRFHRLTLHFRYHGKNVTDVRRIEKNGAYWGYAIVRQSGI